MADWLLTLTRGWNSVRIMRVFFGLVALLFGFLSQDRLLIAAGIILTAMGLLNAGCGMNGACALRAPQKKGTAATTGQPETNLK